jgi:hypothetical protein
MRKLLVLLAIVSTVVLSSCALLPVGVPIIGDYHEQAHARMEQIAEAANNGDAAALKALFSSRALEQAADIDEGLEYLMSFFPEGGVTWERDAIGTVGENNGGHKTQMLGANYKVSVDGEEYWLYFADFTVNEVDPENVGLYALGVTPWTEDIHSGAAEPFSAWVSGIGYRGATGKGYPGVYVPE